MNCPTDGKCFTRSVVYKADVADSFFMKPNNKVLYVHRQSNHPPATLKNIPDNINKRLSSISSSHKVFDEATPPYQKALDEDGYKH